MTMRFEVRAIAWVRSTRSEIADDGWDDERATVELADDVPGESLDGIDAFSHLELVALADRASDVPPGAWARRPRGNPEWPVAGIFAQRNKDRPNRILCSTVGLHHRDARSLVVTGCDFVDGTPILDIKPVFSWSGPRGPLTVPPWSDALGIGYFG